MAKIKVTSANVDTKAVQWLNAPGADTIVFYDENFKYSQEELIRLAFNLGHVVKIVSLEGKIKEIQYVSGTV